MGATWVAPFIIGYAGRRGGPISKPRRDLVESPGLWEVRSCPA